MALLALFNIAGWNGLLLFGVQQLPAGRSAILAFTMPVWSVLFSLALLHEPLSKRKVVGMALGVLGLGVLLGEDIRHLQRTPTAALFIVGGPTPVLRWCSWNERRSSAVAEGSEGTRNVERFVT